MRAFLIVMVILLVLLLVFAIQNPGSTEVQFITFSSSAPLILIILISAFVGLLLGVAVMLPGSLRRSTRLRRLDAEIRALEKRAAEPALQSQSAEGTVAVETAPPPAAGEKTADGSASRDEA